MPSSFDDYEEMRIKEGLQMLERLQIPYFGIMSMWAGAQILGGHLLLGHASLIFLLQACAILILKLIHGQLGSYNRNSRLIGVLANVWFFSSSVMARAYLCLRMESEVTRHRAYLLSMSINLFYFAAISYMPGYLWAFVLFPIFTMSWTWFHVEADFFHISSFLAGVLICLVAWWYRDHKNRLAWQSFQTLQELKDALASNERMLQELKDAHANNEQLLAAQERLLSSIFDASCICDTMGCITQCTHHMQQMLANANDNEAQLTGRHLSSFAANAAERERVMEFLRQAAESAVHNAVTIQASLASGLGEVGNMMRIEAKFFCIKLPNLRRAVSSELLRSEHGDESGAVGGFFVGLQTLQNLDLQELEADESGAAVPMGRTPTDVSEHKSKDDGASVGSGGDHNASNVHTIEFEACSERLDLLKCSPLFNQDATSSTCSGGLLDLLPDYLINDFHAWVSEEVSRAPIDQISRSRTSFDTLVLATAGGHWMPVSRSWLEIPRRDSPQGVPRGFSKDVSLAVTLILQDVGTDAKEKLELPSATSTWKQAGILPILRSAGCEKAQKHEAVCHMLSRVAVVRHAERADSAFSSEWLGSKDAETYPHDPPITDAGVEQARSAGQSLSKLGKFHIVISSPYLRCVQTALIIAESLDCCVLLDQQLGELYGPDIFGEVVPKRAWRKWHSLVSALDTGPGPRSKASRARVQAARLLGKPLEWPESSRDARRRYAYRFLIYLRRARHTRQNCVLVTHGPMIQACASVLPGSASYELQSVEYCAYLVATCRSLLKQGDESSGMDKVGDIRQRSPWAPDTPSSPESGSLTRVRSSLDVAGSSSLEADKAEAHVTPSSSEKTMVSRPSAVEMVRAAALHWWEVSFSNIRIFKHTRSQADLHDPARLTFLQQVVPSWSEIDRLLGTLPPITKDSDMHKTPETVDDDGNASFSTHEDTVSSMGAFRNPRLWQQSHGQDDEPTSEQSWSAIVARSESPQETHIVWRTCGSGKKSKDLNLSTDTSSLMRRRARTQST